MALWGCLLACRLKLALSHPAVSLYLLSLCTVSCASLQVERRAALCKHRLCQLKLGWLESRHNITFCVGCVLSKLLSQLLRMFSAEALDEGGQEPEVCPQGTAVLLAATPPSCGPVVWPKPPAWAAPHPQTSPTSGDTVKPESAQRSQVGSFHLIAASVKCLEIKVLPFQTHICCQC